jgi:hypothetical protein
MPASLRRAAAELVEKNNARVRAPQGVVVPQTPEVDTNVVASLDVDDVGTVSVCSITLDKGAALVLVPALVNEVGVATRVGTPAFVAVPAGANLDLTSEAVNLGADGFTGAVFNFPALNGRLLVLVTPDLSDLNSAWLPGLR